MTNVYQVAPSGYGWQGHREVTMQHTQRGSEERTRMLQGTLTNSLCSSMLSSSVQTEKWKTSHKTSISEKEVVKVCLNLNVIL